MILINTAGLLVISLDRGNGCLTLIGAAFITLQAATAYLTAGFSKMLSPVWRSGDALKGIMTTAMFGNVYFSPFIASSRIWAQVLSFSAFCSLVVIGFSILAGSHLAYFAIALSVAFHLSVAIFMDLNLFVWTFGASIPSILYMSDWNNRVSLFDCVKQSLFTS
jgi:hypothetical protein